MCCNSLFCAGWVVLQSEVSACCAVPVVVYVAWQNCLSMLTWHGCPVCLRHNMHTPPVTTAVARVDAHVKLTYRSPHRKLTACLCLLLAPVGAAAAAAALLLLL
jgi:hypothetical protein